MESSTTTSPSSTPDQEDQPETSEELRWQYAGGDSDLVGERLNSRDMRRRLPVLVRRSFSMAWRIDRRSTAALVGCQIASGLLSALGLFATTRALSSVIAAASDPARLRGALPAVLVLAAAAGLRSLLGTAIQSLSQRLQPRIARDAGHQLLIAGTRTEMASFDHPGFTDRYSMAERGVDAAERSLGQTQNLVSSLVTLIAASLVVATLYPALLALLLLAAVPQAVTAIKGEQITYVATVATFRDQRVLYLLRWWMMDKENADQIRTDTVAPFLLGKYAQAGARVDATTDRAVSQRAKITVAGAAISGLAAAVLWGAVFYLLDTRRISPAEAGTAVFALRSAAQGIQGIIGFGSDVIRSGLYLDDWANYVQEAQEHLIDTQRGTTVPARPQTITLDKVSFRYPGAEQDTLHEIDLSVRSGEILAVVGVNGSGKTSLMKLLCGLNTATSGTTAWDGIDVRDLDPDAMWRQTAVVPQEFARWPLTCRENINLGQPHPDGDEAVLRAAAASGADDVIDSLRSGLDTLLAREMWGGQALSSGQWQRLAVARAIHRDSGLLVMDEPASDLDPAAEHRIFTGLRALAHDRAVVLVTHNLTTTAVADRIICLEQGRITQRGTYQELTTTPGIFRQLWLLGLDRQLPGQQQESER